MVVQMIVPALIQGMITKAVTGAANQTNAIEAVNVEEVAQAVAKELMKDPVAINQMNMEPVSQSRVVQGTSVASVASAIAVLMHFFFPDTEWEQVAAAVVTLIGAGYALWGRLAPNLPPVPWWKFP